MSGYTIFFENKHPKWAQRLLIFLNRALLKYLFSEGVPQTAAILEVGPGKGYFYQALQAYSGITYYACDQNPYFSEQFSLPKENFITASIPPLPEYQKKFDLIYAAYVVEHLQSGEEIRAFILSCKEQLQSGGKLVLACPNALRQGMEFWNMDYTHKYPTTKRNMAMVLQDAGFCVQRMHDINGLLTVPGFASPVVTLALKCIFLFFWYPVYHLLFGWIFKKPLYVLENPFYQLYCLGKQQNLLIIATVSE